VLAWIELLVFNGLRYFLGRAVAELVRATGIKNLSILSLLANPLPLAAIWLVWAKARGRTLREFGLFLPRSWITTLVVALIALAAQAALSIVIFPLVDPLLETWLHADRHEQASRYAFLAGDLGAYLGWIALVWLFAAIGEELFYRGLVLRQLERGLGGKRVALILAFIIQAALFGLHHSGSGLIAVIHTTVAGLVFGAAFLRSGRNLAAPILAHGLWDTFGLTMLYLGASS
jgi:uncharacterized protein